MSNLVPRWITKRYIKLLKKYGYKEFRYNDAKKLLKEKDERMISIALSELGRADWIKKEKDPKDKRKSIYQLRRPEQIFKEVDV